MHIPVMAHSIGHVWFIAMGLMSFLLPIALAEQADVAAQSVNQTQTGECTGELRPDRVVIVGGISAQGLKPALAKAQLDKQIEAIRQYIAGKMGRLTLFEVLRAAQSATRTASSENTATQPFILVQSLEVEFPLTEDIDAILERLLQLGLDRFGKQVSVEASSYGRNVMVYYRFSDLRSQLDRLQAACKQRLVEQWCQSATGRRDSEACKATEHRDQWFATLNASLQSNPVLRDQGGRAPFYLQYPWQSAQLSQVEMMGSVPLLLSGPLTIRTPSNLP
jgi:hypothetical protein